MGALITDGRHILRLSILANLRGASKVITGMGTGAGVHPSSRFFPGAKALRGKDGYSELPRAAARQDRRLTSLEDWIDV